MRIGIIAHLKHPIAEPFSGGLEMHTHLMARLLRERGHKVTLFASVRSDPQLGLESICTETEMQAVGSSEAGDVPFFREHHAYLSLMNGLRHRSFDIIHNNSLHYLPVAMADALPMPMVTTLHTPPFCWLESGIRLCRSRQSAIVAVSESIRSQWSHVAPIDRVILNGIDLERFAFRPLPDSQSYLVWHGRIVREKGLHLAMEAALRVGLPLRIAGPILDEGYYRDEIRPGLGRQAQYLGHLDHKELASVVGGARAFLCTPRWDEPYGLVVAEALACGVPVAAFARGAIPEIIDRASGVLSAPDDPVALAAATLSALGLDRRACRQRAETACDATRMIDGYEALYARMVAGRVQAGEALAIANDLLAAPRTSIRRRTTVPAVTALSG